MTSTNFHVGLTENNRSSSKVLKPPGGGTSDIFGAPAPTPRSVKNHLASNIFSNTPDGKSTTGDARRPVQDSHNRLFGEADRPFTPAKNHLRSNIPIGNADTVDTSSMNGSTTSNGTNGHAATNGNSDKQNGDVHSINGNGSTKNELDDVAPAPDSPRSVLSHTTPRSTTSEIQSPNSVIIDFVDNANTDEPNEVAMDSSDNNELPQSDENNTIEKPDHLDISIEISTNEPETEIINDSNTNSSSITETSSSTMSPLTDDSSHVNPIVKSPRMMARNPVTGFGIEDTIRKTRKLDLHRDGNPVTGEGYKSEINTQVPSLNGAKQVINKNRIPPGGFSSGLW